MIEGKAHVESLDAEHELAVEDVSGIDVPEEQVSPARRMILNMARNTRPPMACCALCWNWTARPF